MGSVPDSIDDTGAWATGARLLRLPRREGGAVAPVAPFSAHLRAGHSERHNCDVAKGVWTCRDGVALRWQELRAAQIVELHDQLERWARLFELPEPAGEQVEQVRQILRREADR